MFQSVQMGNLCMRQGNNEYSPNHAPFLDILCVRNIRIGNESLNCIHFQFVQTNLPLRSHLHHPILACQRRFVPSVALSWPIDEFYRCMDSETMNRQVPCHKFQTHTLARMLALNPFSTLDSSVS